MAVNQECNPGDGAVALNVQSGEYLLYSIPEADPNVQYVLTDGMGGRLFDNATCPAPCQRKWPQEGDTVPSGEAKHVLAMQFFGEDRLMYKVEKHASDGQLLDVVKDCTFANSGTSDDFFEGLRIFLT